MTIALKLLDDINHEFAVDDPDYTPKQLSNQARALIRRYHWPGNVRELYNVLLQAAIMCDGDSISDTDLRAGVTAEPDPTGKPQEMDLPIGDGFVLDDLLADIQRHYIARAMDEAEGVKVKAAKLLGFRHYQTLDQRMRRYGVELD